MDSLLFGTLAATIMLFAFGVYAYVLQGRLAKLDDACNDAIRLIAIQLNTRWVSMENLAHELFKYSPSDGVAQQEAISEKRQFAPVSVELVEKQDEAIEQVRRSLIAACSIHAPMKSYNEYQSPCQKSQAYDEHVVRTLSIYNNAAQKINDMLAHWPSRPVARLLGFQHRRISYMIR